MNKLTTSTKLLQEHSQQFNNRHLFESPKANERLVFELVAMEDTPPESNPFHHDMSSMGSEIARGITAMYYTPTDGMAMENFYLHFHENGQRLRLVSMSEVPRPKKVIYIDIEHVDIEGYSRPKHGWYNQLEGVQHPSRNYPLTSCTNIALVVNPVNHENLDQSPVWFVWESVGILMDWANKKPAITREEYEEYSDGDFTATKSFMDAYDALESRLKAASENLGLSISTNKAISDEHVALLTELGLAVTPIAPNTAA